MLATHPGPMSVESFLDWIARQDDRHELVDGFSIRKMAGAKQSHNVVVGNLADAMRPGAKAAGCRATSNDTAIISGPAACAIPTSSSTAGPPTPTR